MKIAVWHTGHPIADHVGRCISEALNTHLIAALPGNIVHYADKYDLHIGYGILRGMGDVFRAAEQQKKLWINIDRGYWQPGHFDGYYRFSLRGTQQTAGLGRLAQDVQPGGMSILGTLSILPPVDRPDGYDLYCPPTPYVCGWLGFTQQEWLDRNVNKTSPHMIRNKGDAGDLDAMLAGAKRVITFNSSVGWEALRRGIPVHSDPHHSIVGAWMRENVLDETFMLQDYNRHQLFAVMASLQLTLTEVREGKLQPLLDRLIRVS